MNDFEREEYKNLLSDYIKASERILELEKDNEKLKKAIEILKRFNFKVCENRIFTDSLMEYEEITQQEYELLKEVLGNGLD